MRLEKLFIMTTVIIDNQKKGSQEMLELLRVLDFVKSIETSSENVKRQKLMKYPQKYDPLALAGAAENFPLNLSRIRKEWTKTK